MTFAAPGNALSGPDGSPRPASAGDSGTSTRRPPSPPGRRNPESPAPAARQAQRTAAPHPATTWGKPPEGNSPSRHGANTQVKRQVKSLFGNLYYIGVLDIPCRGLQVGEVW